MSELTDLIDGVSDSGGVYQVRVCAVLETINWLALTVPFIAAGSAYFGIIEKQLPKILAAVAAAAIMVATFVGYTYLYRAIGFPLWMRWLT